jgi:hypothetical protein
MITIARVTIVIMAVFIMGTAQLANAEAPQEVQQAAKIGLSNFLANLSVSDLANMGFMNQMEINAATLGTPFEMFTITPAALNSYQAGKRLSSLITTTNIWIFPVLVNGSPRSMLQVGIVNGRWEGGSFGGGALLPTRWLEMQTGASSMMAQNGVKIINPKTRFVRIFQAQQDLMIIETASADYIQPIISNTNLNLMGMTLYSPDQVIPNLKIEVSRAVQQWNNEQLRKKIR